MKHVAKFWDLCAIALAIAAALFVFDPSTKSITLAGFLAMRIKLGNGLLFLLFLVVWYNLFVLCGLYVSKRLATRLSQVTEVCKATLLAAVFLFLAAKVFHLGLVRPGFVGVFWLVCTSIMLGARLVSRPILLFLRSRGRNTRFLLIFGTNERAIEFADHIAAHPELGYKIVGFVDDDWAGTAAFEATGHGRCCNFDGLADLLRMDVVDEAAIYLPLRSYYEHAAQLVSQCEQHGIVIRFDSQIFKMRSAPAQYPDLEDSTPILSVSTSVDGLQAVVKRSFDFVFSLAFLLLLSPVFLVIAALIKLTSPGPVFFSQTRIGLNKRQFRFYKFRTMIQDAEKLQDELLAMNEMDGPVFKIAKDPRITPLGRILRKTSIDELPQLWNVLVGDMSLVGPRAMSLRDYRLFEEDWQRRRFSVKPGITCLWQICGRNSIPFEQWMELDMQYIDKWSLWLDLKILARTVPAVLRGTGAA